MRISRKDFLKTSSVLAGGLFIGFNNSFAKVLALQDSGFKEIRNGVGTFTQKGGTIGWYITKDAAVVVDTQFPDTAETFLKNLKTKTNSRINILFNTHHHGDHTSGNIFLKNYADKIVAHENCPKLQLKQNKGTDKEKNQAYADTTFKTTWEADAGNETVTARYFGAAHTGGDSAIEFNEANIVHLGDLVFNETYPYIDMEGGGSIEGWIDVLERASKRYSGDTLFIFGHAASDELITGKKDAIIRMRNYLSALMEYVSKQSDAGKSLDEIKKAEFIPLFKKMKARWEGALAGNIEAAYSELNKGKNK